MTELSVEEIQEPTPQLSPEPEEPAEPADEPADLPAEPVQEVAAVSAEVAAPKKRLTTATNDNAV